VRVLDKIKRPPARNDASANRTESNVAASVRPALASASKMAAAKGVRHSVMLYLYCTGILSMRSTASACKYTFGWGHWSGWSGRDRMSFTAEPLYVTHTTPLPKHTKDMPFKGVCPVGETLQPILLFRIVGRSLCAPQGVLYRL